MRHLAIIGLALALLSAAGGVAAGLGYRFEFFSLGTGFSVLRWSAYGGIAAAALSLIFALWILRQSPYRGLISALAGFTLGAAVAAVPYSHLRLARSVPPIHDISTDVETPPHFVAVLPLRANAPNTADYGGESVARQQRAAYPEIGPVHLNLPSQQAFARALAAARDLGWEIVAAVPDEGRIEATDRSFWFGFKDDVVVRVRAENDGSRIDARSVSRVGRSDVGANARRLRRFLKSVAEQTASY